MESAEGTPHLLVVVGALMCATACGSADSSALFRRSGPDVSGLGGQFAAGDGGASGAMSFGNGGTVVVSAGGFTSAGGAGTLGAGGLGAGGAGGPGGAGGASAGGLGAGGDGPPGLAELAKCNFSGTWATFVRVPVKWPGAPFVLLEGTGEVKQWTISHRVQDSLLALHETVSACSIYLPDLTGSVLTSNQSFGIRFPNSLFDTSTAPPWPFNTTVQLVDGQAQWSTEAVATLTGVSLPSPATDAWPSPLSPSALRDDEGDGNPGVTVVPVDPATDSRYNFPPVGFPPLFGVDYPRAKLIFIASRSVVKLHGTVKSCDELNGAADIVVLGGTPSINSTVVGCVKTTGETCTADEAGFLDQNRPQFTPTGPGTLVSVRMPDSATCADVRARFPGN